MRQFSREWSAGYASPPSDSSHSPIVQNSLELLDPSGKLLEIPWEQIKWICYLRDPLQSRGSGADALNPERLLRRRFSGRPRMKGLWLRIVLTDGDELEGVAANDRSLLDSVGLMLIPPDTRSNTQRVFVPRTAIRELTVLGVLGATPARTEANLQPELFPAESTE